MIWTDTSVSVNYNFSDPTYDFPGSINFYVTSPVTGSNTASCTVIPPTGRYTCSVTSINSSGSEADAHFLVSLTP